MTTDPSTKPHEDDAPGERTSLLPWIACAAVAGFAATIGWYLVLRDTFGKEFHLALSDHAAIGNAVAPVGTLLSLGALLAALYAVELQRRDLQLQREEMRAQREVMKEQHAQFERTAAAQEKLANAQETAARAQINANREAAALRLAQHTNTISILLSARATIEASEMAHHVGATGNVNELKFTIWGLQKQIADALDRETTAEAQLRERFGKGEAT